MMFFKPSLLLAFFSSVTLTVARGGFRGGPRGGGGGGGPFDSPAFQSIECVDNDSLPECAYRPGPGEEAGELGVWVCRNITKGSFSTGPFNACIHPDMALPDEGPEDCGCCDDVCPDVTDCVCPCGDGDAGYWLQVTGRDGSERPPKCAETAAIARSLLGHPKSKFTCYTDAANCPEE